MYRDGGLRSRVCPLVTVEFARVQYDDIMRPSNALLLLLLLLVYLLNVIT